ncbi:unnamed protein product [Fusarium graminearum]|uniref:Chromosome 2, complete genome n=2 Tax=Gibberella zeae TaxID=5518 RepID=I1S8X3_GIBZE|nr:hypothetical protein FGSG_13302 [Fusarium graminearum PH-1]CAF3599406.1 unnamed protein product [Fusarium graminearum]ESU14538.1 hypothetical protein FGSG_13302 [Fusarium graminearum PH-1]CAG1960601.1 unnamed protein product [Fusarium graminearum]CAG2000794.1 unnamed protein product [Fusarium graminearum]CEF77183.1 unnamed protein product [Fusarium graminearum]|eukprot:XP_011319963.1 hypothetical protein FGSG_13302 [Fusarium graminearum PH-1]
MPGLGFRNAINEAKWIAANEVLGMSSNWRLFCRILTIRYALAAALLRVSCCISELLNAELETGIFAKQTTSTQTEHGRVDRLTACCIFCSESQQGHWKFREASLRCI